MTDDELTRTERRELHDAVLRVVDYQTSPMQPPGTTARVIGMILARREKYDVDAVERVRRGAVENNRLLSWTTDGGATWRYTRCTEPDLDRLARWAGERGARELVGRAYRAKQEVTAE